MSYCYIFYAFCEWIRHQLSFGSVVNGLEFQCGRIMLIESGVGYSRLCIIRCMRWKMEAVRTCIFL